MHIYIGARIVVVETDQGRVFAICNPRLLSDLPVVLACNSAAVNVPPYAVD
jgi:hypothetical protein